MPAFIVFRFNIACTAAASLLACTSPAPAAAPKPNVVVILADDRESQRHSN